VRVPLSWLREYAPVGDDVEALVQTLDDLGLVVEGTEQIGEGLGDVVVAEVVDIAPIEGADRIRRVVVDDGTGSVEVVCGAWNFAVGDRVPLAPVGSVLPGGFAIGRRKLRGVVSDGMLCSSRELALGDDHRGILVLAPDATGERPRPGTPLLTALGLEGDVVFDIAVEANRPDALSVTGVARDLAARLDLELALPEPPALAPAAVAPAGPNGLVAVESPDLCPRFVARVLAGVVVGPSPRWLARRLELAGMRPINNVVDASNYVMLELGQPTHPYDRERLARGRLVVRRARPGERIVTLDGVERVLGRPGPGLGDTGEDCVICDGSGTPVALGGVMGGASSEIGPETRTVLLEAAYFAPLAVARTSKRLGLRTEASVRFERGCDPAGIDRAVARLCELLALSAGPDFSVEPVAVDVRGDVPEPARLRVRTGRVNALLGTDFSEEDVMAALVPLGMTVGRAGDDVLEVTVPTFRPDIRPAPHGEADIAEEVARTSGYSSLPRTRPAWPQPGRLTSRQRDRRRLREAVCGLGAFEVWTSAFATVEDHERGGAAVGAVEVANPLAADERLLRTSLVPGLVGALRYNEERRSGGLRLFEVGSVFAAAPAGDPGGVPVRTTERFALALAGPGDDAWSAVAAWRVVADVLRVAEWSVRHGVPGSPAPSPLHPFRSGVLTCLGPEGERVEVGVVGELHPHATASLGLSDASGRAIRVGWLDLDLDVLLEPGALSRRPEQASPVSRFPSSDVDLAFVVDEAVPAAAVRATLLDAGGAALESVTLFDVYRGPSVPEGTRSLAYRVRLCALDHTLTDAELAERRAAMIVAVESRHGASLR
jgi:phenylalanyl-tRNA synthetase beta chain